MVAGDKKFVVVLYILVVGGGGGGGLGKFFLYFSPGLKCEH